MVPAPERLRRAQIGMYELVLGLSERALGPLVDRDFDVSVDAFVFVYEFSHSTQLDLGEFSRFAPGLLTISADS
jgi:hypothetical protein